MLQIQNISFSYSDEITLNEITFSISKGKNLAVIGESGCGKSTLLKLIYGLHDLNKGSIFWNENEVLGPKYHLIPGMEYMKYLAQDFDLMPFITVGENIGKFLSNEFPEVKKERINELLSIVEMSEFKNTKAKFLSGGQMQRIAIARVLALEPEVLLLDEPFSHIDNFQKNSLRRKLFKYLKEKQITTIVASHDSTDVLSFSDTVLVMKAGKIIAEETPENLYNHPSNFYIASLFGDVNEIEIDGVKRLIYPHQLEIVTSSNIKVEVIQAYFKGNSYLVEASFQNATLYFESPTLISVGKIICLAFIQ